MERSLNAAQAAAEGVLETASGKASGFGPSGFLCAYGFDRGLAHECEEESTKTQEASEKHAVFAVEWFS